MTRQAYVLHDCRLAVFWTQKAACTTIAHAIAEQVVGMGPVWRRRTRGSATKSIIKESLYECEKLLGIGPGQLTGAWRTPSREWLRDKGYQVSGEEALELCRQEGYASIALIREPYERLVSAYFSKFVQKRGSWLTSPEMLETFSRVALNDCADRQGVSSMTTRGWTFREFVEYVCEFIDDSTTADGALDPHWNTQIPPAFRDTGFSYDHLYSTADSNSFFSKLGELTGKRITPGSLNQTVRSAPQVPAQTSEMTDIPCFELARQQFADLNAVIDPGLRVRVRQSFDIDYSFLENRENGVLTA